MLQIDLPTRVEIEQLASYRGAPAVSIYLPTSPITQDVQVDRIELKNLLRTAIGQLEAIGTDKRSIRSIEEAVEGLIEDDGFWVNQANSLAVFATTETVRTFRLANKLAAVVEVSDRFHINPLLRAISFSHNAYVLAISIGSVRLIEILADFPPNEVPVPDMPRDFNDALGKRSHIERGGGMRSGESTSEHAMLTRYARAVDQALRPVLTGHESPLIVAASEPLASIFRAVSRYPHTTGRVISGSADRTPDHELAAEARAVLDIVHAEQLAEVADLFATRSNQGRATTDVSQAARAATFGAIDTLVVDMDEVLPGTVDDGDGAVTFAERPGAASYGVLDEIASRALRTGAWVISARKIDIPGGGSLAAILRYPI